MHIRREDMMNIEKNLKGMAVITSETGDRLGDVIDAIVHPIEGTVLGLAVRISLAEERAVPMSLVTIGHDAVIVRGSIGDERDAVIAELSTGEYACAGLVGTNVITEDGTHLGRVSEVWMAPDETRTALRVVENSLQKLFSGGFFIAGDVPTSYSHDGARMIVPANARDRYGARSSEEAIRPAANR